MMKGVADIAESIEQNFVAVRKRNVEILGKTMDKAECIERLENLQHNIRQMIANTEDIRKKSALMQEDLAVEFAIAMLLEGENNG